MFRIIRAALLVFLTTCCLSALFGDEGLWLFNRFPKEQVQQRYGFTVTDSFLDHLRVSSVRFNNGGSGSFISPEGLLFTNHHVGAECIHQLSRPGHDYMAAGFYAKTLGEEKACPSLEVNVLLSIEDVTDRVNAGVTATSGSAEGNRIRKANMASVEKTCTEKTGNRCDVVTLYSGAVYDLYQYKKYTDVRLVLAPESDVAAFGGDPDNFTYPRYCLDFTLFRAYENGKPVRPADYLRWSRTGVKDGELVFVPGNPGTTGRLATMAQLQFYRDESYPLTQERLERLIKVLQIYGANDTERRRQAEENLLRFQNSYKAYTGFLRGLRDSKLMAAKEQEEFDLKKAVDADPGKARKYGRIWDEVAEAYKEYARIYKDYYLLESSPAPGSELFNIARNVLRLSEERSKPNDQRLREYRDSALASLEQDLYSTAPVYDSLEIAEMAEHFRFLKETLGASHPVVLAVLSGRSPEEAAHHYVTTSKLKDVNERKRLAADPRAARESKDGMMELARILDPAARKMRKAYEDRVEAVVRASAGKMAEVRFAVRGAGEYPDATFTMRINFAQVKGYRNEAGDPVPYATTFRGLYARNRGEEPYKLPEHWLQDEPKLNLDTPFDFVSTADTHGGNSGSPTVNASGEVVGILFDGNLEGLPNRFIYTEEQARSVHVASQAIEESLRRVFDAERILKEMDLRTK